MGMKDGRHNEPEKTKRGDALPWQIVGVCAGALGIPLLYQLPNILEQFAHLTCPL